MPNIHLDAIQTTELTDAAATLTRFVDCSRVEDVVVDIKTNRATTVVITPVLSDDNTYVGKASDTLTLTTGGGTERAIYSKIGSKRAKVVATKTEAGSTTGFRLLISGINRELR